MWLPGRARHRAGLAGLPSPSRRASRRSPDPHVEEDPWHTHRSFADGFDAAELPPRRWPVVAIAGTVLVVGVAVLVAVAALWRDDAIGRGRPALVSFAAYRLIPAAILFVVIPTAVAATFDHRRRGRELDVRATLRREADGDSWDWHTATRGGVASIRPDNVGTMRASMSFESEPLTVDAQLHVLEERFRGVGWQSRRILVVFRARPEEFYTQRMEQVMVSTWTKGRVALLGDAAWGSGPTGMGTTLALVAAHVLAGELANHPDDPSIAFERYERMLRRFADSAQGLPPGGARLLHPSSRLAVGAMRTAMRVASSTPLRNLFQSHLLTSEKHVPTLPDYPALRVA